jgi:16S rRNA (guanine527-N7)-methyltransferase
VFHVKHEGLREAAASLGVALDEAQADRLAAYESTLAARAGVLGMIAPGDLSRLRERHLLDSLRAAVILPGAARTAADLGSGAGLPGIPLAIARPDVRFVLAETRQQRIAFLELTAERLGIGNVSVHAGRAEDVAGPVDVCLARAFRDAAGSWRVAEGLLAPEGCLIYFAGRRFDLGNDVPAGVAATLAESPALANAGPLVIMTRQ